MIIYKNELFQTITIDENKALDEIVGVIEDDDGLEENLPWGDCSM